MSDPTEQIAIVGAFLRLCDEDRRKGVVRSLADYQQRFPGFEKAIADEYRTLQEPAAAATPMPDDQGREIARGGMGIVYRVWDPELQREVARKVMRRTHGGDATVSVQAAERFVREARLTGRLNHPGIVPVHALAHDDGLPSFTMAIVEGQDFGGVIRALHAGSDPTWTLPRAVEVILRVCDAVAFAHDKRIVHRDLKPQNVRIGRFGQVYVLDWGLARCLAADDDPAGEDGNHGAAAGIGATLDGDVIGTPAYMPPEQARGDLAAIDERTDVYAIGAMLYELLRGHPPFLVDGGDNSSRAVLARSLAGPPAPLDRVPRLPAELVAVCQKAMARAPDDRYPTVPALAADLRAFLEQRVVSAYEVGAFAELRKWVHRNRAFAAASALALLSLVVGVLISTVQKRAADANAALAEQNLDLALAAGDDLLGTVGHLDLENEAGADPLRQELLDKALAYYTRLQDLRGDHPRVLDKLALTLMSIAGVQAQLGQREAARQSWHSARDTLNRLVERVGPTPKQRHRLAKVEAQLANATAQTGDARAALPQLEQAAAELAALRPLHPDSAVLLGDAANVAHSRAMAHLQLGQPEAALAQCHEEILICRRIVELAPEAEWAHSKLGGVHQLEGRILWQLERRDEAEASYRAGIDGLRTAQQASPSHRGLRFRLAEIQNLCAILLFEGERNDEADELWQSAVTLLRELVQEYPGVGCYHGNLGGTLCNLGMLRARQQQPDLALELFDEALPQVRRALAIDPRARDYQDFRRSLGSETAAAALGLGDHARAVATLREWMSDLPQGSAFASSMLMAQCVGFAAADLALPADERERLIDDYGRQTVAWLNALHARRPLTREQLARRAFHDIRQRADFRQLVDSLPK